MTPNEGVRGSPVLERAYAFCGGVVAAHYENFPVASLLLPPDIRPHVAAVYAFARVADDFADEGSRGEAERHHLINEWRARLHRSAGGAALAETHDQLDGPDQIFLALGETIRRCQLPMSLFEDLLSAFRQDITTHRYETWEAVLDYCRRSANPVGRLVLRIAGYRDEALDQASDALCTALQLTNFWQDLEVDWAKGRLYIPSSTWQAAGALESDLTARRMTPAWRAALTDAAGRTRALFRAGAAVCEGVRGRLRWELRATWLGGTRILDKLEAAEFDVFAHRPTLTAMDAPLILWRTATWSRVASER